MVLALVRVIFRLSSSVRTRFKRSVFLDWTERVPDLGVTGQWDFLSVRLSSYKEPAGGERLLLWRIARDRRD